MFTLLKLFNFLHLAAAVTWIGGMLFINLTLMPKLTAIVPQERGKLIGAVTRRFSVISWICIVILLITGYLKTPEGMMFDTASVYGTILAAKHVLILLMIIFGIILTLVLVPRINRLAPKPGEAPSAEFVSTQKKLSFFSVANTIAGVLVILCIGLMR